MLKKLQLPAIASGVLTVDARLAGGWRPDAARSRRKAGRYRGQGGGHAPRARLPELGPALRSHARGRKRRLASGLRCDRRVPRGAVRGRRPPYVVPLGIPRRPRRSTARFAGARARIAAGTDLAWRARARSTEPALRTWPPRPRRLRWGLPESRSPWPAPTPTVREDRGQRTSRAALAKSRSTARASIATRGPKRRRGVEC